jgi:glycosyltransferase involved in cell wall biosynthesis
VKVILFANTDWYLYNFRLAFARHLRAGGAHVIMLCPPGPFVARLMEQGFTVIQVAMNRRGIGPLTQLRTLLDLYKVYTRERPDIVHHFTVKSVILGSLAARLAGVRGAVNAVAGQGFIYSSNGLYANVLRPLVNGALKMALSGNDRRLVLQNGDDLKRFLQSGLVRSDRVRLIRGSGVDTSRFSEHARPGGGPTRVLLATRLLVDKGVHDYVHAARLLQDSTRSIQFLIAGEPDHGNPNSVRQRDLDAWIRSGVVRHLGHVENMSQLMAEVDIVCLPTFYGEGVPRVLIEAAASGLPIVATDIPGCREIVEHESNGLLVSPKDPVQLVKAILRLHEDPALRESMGAAGRRKAVEEFDEEIVIRQTADVYRELVDDQWPAYPLAVRQAANRTLRSTPASSALVGASGNTSVPTPGAIQSQH